MRHPVNAGYNKFSESRSLAALLVFSPLICEEFGTNTGLMRVIGQKA